MSSSSPSKKKVHCFLQIDIICTFARQMLNKNITFILNWKNGNDTIPSVAASEYGFGLRKRPRSESYPHWNILMDPDPSPQSEDSQHCVSQKEAFTGLWTYSTTRGKLLTCPVVWAGSTVQPRPPSARGSVSEANTRIKGTIRYGSLRQSPQLF
jgi:hypothetical protein